ncbi:unnamed protein product [Trypanosoma congolense IL3000]|uniref:WGS project CAEQ00000000 data, annotated contig 2235 n=1 Tax=Trypanosoma congolense (strain IL3000) TaxID=1068625 RepID=F9WCI2_TRYCI|nr:unnamed protein product [Trypanosoma congolense IL3000]
MKKLKKMEGGEDQRSNLSFDVDINMSLRACLFVACVCLLTCFCLVLFCFFFQMYTFELFFSFFSSSSPPPLHYFFRFGFFCIFFVILPSPLSSLSLRACVRVHPSLKSSKEAKTFIFCFFCLICYFIRNEGGGAARRRGRGGGSKQLAIYHIITSCMS